MPLSRASLQPWFTKLPQSHIFGSFQSIPSRSHWVLGLCSPCITRYSTRMLKVGRETLGARLSVAQLRARQSRCLGVETLRGPVTNYCGIAHTAMLGTRAMGDINSLLTTRLPGCPMGKFNGPTFSPTWYSFCACLSMKYRCHNDDRKMCSTAYLRYCIVP